MLIRDDEISTNRVKYGTGNVIPVCILKQRKSVTMKVNQNAKQYERLKCMKQYNKIIMIFEHKIFLWINFMQNYAVEHIVLIMLYLIFLFHRSLIINPHCARTDYSELFNEKLVFFFGQG